MKRLLKRVLIVTGVVAVALVAIGAAVLRLPAFGGRPDAADIERFGGSTRFDAESGRFRNPNAEEVDAQRAESLSPSLIGELFERRPYGRPDGPLPEREPELDAFVAPGGPARAIWFGHSTFLLNVDGLIVLVDPVFSPSASPVAFAVRRFQPPVTPIESLPPIDVVLISHDHYDHLDADSIAFLAGTDAAFVAPLGIGAHLTRWGVDETRIVERDWWQSHTIGTVTFTAAPAQHFSGRGLFDAGRTLWASWVVAGTGTRLYYSGDSGYAEHFAEIGARLGPFDVAFLENGQYDSAWRVVHLLPEETADAFEALGADRLFPVHWGMFQLAFHSWFEPVAELAAIAETRGIELMTPMIGDTVDLVVRATSDEPNVDARPGTNDWWPPLLPERATWPPSRAEPRP